VNIISHSWEDNDISRTLAEYLKRDGADIWIDYARISGGDSLPEIIGNAIEWCNTMVLVWSKSATSSYFVKLEWTCALSNQKKIIPCVLDGAKLPTILSGFLYLDFKNFESGYRSLARDLKMMLSSHKIPSSTPKIMKPKILFRSEPATLSIDDVQAMLKKFDFFDSSRNKNVRGFANEYKAEKIKGDKVVVDEASGLMWQQGGSSENIEYEKAEKWLQQLNDKSYAGYYDWRLPTLAEAMSLMEPKKNENDLYSNHIFDVKQKWIWTSDQVHWTAQRWVVNFYDGYCSNYYLDHAIGSYVRAVRFGQSDKSD